MTPDQIQAISDSGEACSFDGDKISLPDGSQYSIPPRGYGQTSDALSTDDSAPDVTVVRDSDGNVAINYGGVVSGDPDTIAEVTGSDDTITPDNPDSPDATSGYSTSNKCASSSSGAYKEAGYQWNDVFRWWYNGKNSQVNNTDGIARLRAAMDKWNQSITACGHTYTSVLHTAYQGTTSATVGVNADGSCAADDNQSTSGWGALNNSSTIARTCDTYFAGTLYDADTKFNTNYDWYAGSSTSGCSGAMDLQGIATHEYGHAIGLNHVATSTGQVMQPYSKNCATSQRDLGYGDAMGDLDMY